MVFRDGNGGVPLHSSNSLRNLLEVSCNIFHSIIYLRNLLECSTPVTLTYAILLLYSSSFCCAFCGIATHAATFSTCFSLSIFLSRHFLYLCPFLSHLKYSTSAISCLLIILTLLEGQLQAGINPTALYQH